LLDNGTDNGLPEKEKGGAGVAPGAEKESEITQKFCTSSTGEEREENKKLGGGKERDDHSPRFDTGAKKDRTERRK